MSIEEWLDENPEQKEKYEALTDEEKQQLVDAVEKIKGIVSDMLSATLSAIQRICKAFNEFLDSYPNKRVVRLAVHARKKRVRKKNVNRIRKDIERSAKNEHRRAHQVCRSEARRSNQQRHSA